MSIPTSFADLPLRQLLTDRIGEPAEPVEEPRGGDRVHRGG